MTEQEAFDYLVECRRYGKKPSGHIISKFNLDYGKAYCIAHSIDWPRCEICNTQLKAGKNGFGKFCSRSCAMKGQSERNSRINPIMNKKIAKSNRKKYIEKNLDKFNKAVGDYKNTPLTIQEIQKKYNIKGLNTFLKDEGIFDPNRKGRLKKAKINEQFKDVIDKLKDEDWVNDKIKNQGWVSGDFAEHFNCSPNFVATTLRELYYNSPLQHNYGSSLERKVRYHLDNANVRYRTGVRDVISKELDIFIPDKKVAIELNGVYWHSNYKIPKNYHLKKTLECEEKGIDLLHFFCFEINQKMDIVTSIINSRLNLNKRIFARNCNIKCIDANAYRSFCEDNHIQGYAAAKFKLGLYKDEELIAVMSFSKPRFDKNNEYELIRYCSKKYHNVVGGANKLFKHFLRIQNPNSIISYAQKRMFNGNMYSNLGFIKEYDTSPNYFWTNGEKILSRYSTQKHKLNTTLTESEEMYNRGYYKVYDCGQSKWVYQ